MLARVVLFCFLGDLLMSDDDLDDDIETEDDAEKTDIKVDADSIDARRKLEAKLEEMSLRRMTQDYDF